jgi:N-acetylmuramoyl-L-alanine amidase
MGANVIMTRGNDAFVPVGERPKIANRAGADFLISVHADSGDRNHSVNGSTVYYHLQVPSCKALAQSIADQFSDMGGIRTKGTHSDGAQWGGRFVTGFGVLRGSQMVAVLCETGYMSNPGDVNKLNNSAMQKKIAESIANGLKNYVEGNPNFDTRNIQPQDVGVLVPLTPEGMELDASSSSEEGTIPVTLDPSRTRSSR